MKFLSKREDSLILVEGLTYKENRAENNRRLRDMLLAEQKNFCAYTEKYIQGLDATEVEHFNAALKYADDYYNYYAVIRRANEYKIKKDAQYKEASFLRSLFFQNSNTFNMRIAFVDGVYEERDVNDVEARDFIDFLGFNEHPLFEDRNKHVKRLKSVFEDAGWGEEQQLAYFRAYPEELSFITAIETELGLDLSEFYL